MSYQEKDGQVVLSVSRSDYDHIIFALGYYCGSLMKDGQDITSEIKFLNRINQGNPNFVPYATGEKK